MKNRALLITLLTLVMISCKNNQTSDKEELNIENSTVSTEFKDEHTAENSLDWMGEYQGTLPCADCEGIQTTIILNQDGTFSSKERYLKDPIVEVENNGSFSWDESGFIVTLQTDNFTQSYRVVERAIIYLNQDGNEISGELAPLYRLTQK